MSQKKKAIGTNAMHSTNYAMRVFYMLAIVFVVAGHSSINYPSGLNLGYNLFPVYAFHMPMFIFAAGYFYNPKHERHPLRFLAGKVRRLIVPMLAIHALTGWACTALARHGFTWCEDAVFDPRHVLVEPFLHDNMHMYGFDLAMWFLVPMFLASCAYLVVHGIMVHGKGVVRLVLDTVVLVLAVAAGAWVVSTFGSGEAHEAVSQDDMLRVYQSMFFFAFIAIGYYYHTYLERWADRIPDAVAVLGLLMVQLALVYAYGTSLTMVVCWLGFPAGVLGTFLMGLVGTLFWLRVSKIVAPRLEGSWLVDEVGKHTFSIMAFHFFGFFALNCVMYEIHKATGGSVLSSFSEQAFREGGIYYKCIPERMTVSAGAADAWGMTYVLAGLAFPLVLHRVWVVVTHPLRVAWRRLRAFVRGDAETEGDGVPADADGSVPPHSSSPAVRADGHAGGEGVPPAQTPATTARRRAPRPHKRQPRPTQRQEQGREMSPPVSMSDGTGSGSGVGRPADAAERDGVVRDGQASPDGTTKARSHIRMGRR